MSRTSRILLFTLLGFGAYRLARELWFAPLFYTARDATGLTVPAYWGMYLLVGIPVFAVVLWLHQSKGFFDAFGLNRNFPQGALWAFIFNLPMLVGYAVVFELDPEFSWLKAATSGAAAAAFFEELYYRAFLFGQLYRYTRLGFLPAILLGALIFALSHLYQSNDPATLIGIFMTTFLGAFLFAWVYVEWNFNLWVPICLHFFMNLFWMIFSAGDNAFGGWYANIFRIITIALTIIGTILYKRRQGLAMTVNRSSLWLKKTEILP